jgi:hypothetical protein
MSAIVSEETVQEGENTYKVTVYESGTRVKELVSENGEPLPQPLPELPDDVVMNMEMAANVEYLVAVSELSM